MDAAGLVGMGRGFVVEEFDGKGAKTVELVGIDFPWALFATPKVA